MAMSRGCALLSGAIKEVDPARRVTVGVQMGAEPDLTTSLACEDSVDFFSVHVYPQPAYATLAALEDYSLSLLDTLPAQQAGGPRAVVWEEYYPLSMAQGLSLEDGAVANLAASARIRAPLAVTGHYSFYWGNASSLNMTGMGAAIYEQWLETWAASRPF